LYEIRDLKGVKIYFFFRVRDILKSVGGIAHFIKKCIVGLYLNKYFFLNIYFVLFFSMRQLPFVIALLGIKSGRDQK